MRNIPVSGAVITDEDKQKIKDTVDKGWFTEGEVSKQFANELRFYVGSHHATLVNSGSSANLIATLALRDHYQESYPDRYIVIVPATSFPTTVMPILQAGLLPLFVDVNPTTLNPDLSIIRESMNMSGVLGVSLAHTLGFPFLGIKELRDLCDERSIFLLEDCADALGSEIAGERVGHFGHASTFSFFPAHHITCGEGGAVCTDDGRLLRLINSYRDWGRDCWCKPGDSDTCGKRFQHDFGELPPGWDHKYTFTKMGYNLKMTEMQAALGLSQIGRIDQFTERRRANYVHLYDELNCSPVYDVLFLYPLDRTRYIGTGNEQFRASPFGFPITVTTKEFTRRDIVSSLEKRGIHTRPVFAGNITRQPVADEMMFLTNELGLGGSDYVMEHTFWVGCWPGLNEGDMDYIGDVIFEFLETI